VALDGLSKNLIADGDYASVIGLLQSAPRNEDLALDLAQAYGKAKMFDDAGKVLRGALLTNPSSWRVTNALTTVLVNQQHFQEALRITRKYAQLHPQHVEAQRVYLRVLVLNGDSALARPLAHRLLATSPHDPDFLYMNGVLENQAGDFATARKHLQEAVALDPNHYNARYNFGVVLEALKDFNGAREQLEKAIELGATEPEIRFKYSNVLRKLGETQLADAQLKLYQQQMQDRASHALSVSKAAQADKELSSGDPQKAVALYQEAVAAAPQDALLNFKLGLALDKVGDAAAERTALEKALQIDPDMAIAHNQLGYLASHAGDTASAEEHFRQAVRAAPEYKEAWVSLAATLGMESRFSEAQEAVDKALKLDPRNTQALQLRRELSDAKSKR
jgi:Flp pilus assembly protein TadD